MASLRFGSDIYTWQPGQPARRLTDGEGIAYQSCMHPDGERVLYAGAAGDHLAVWEHQIGGGRRQLSPAGLGARHPVYCADGVGVLFTAEVGDPQDVTDLDPSGAPPAGAATDIHLCETPGSSRPVTDGPSADQRPAAHPDGRRFAFVRAGNSLDIHVGDLDGGESRLLVRGPVYRPWFSPDGLWLYYFRFLARDRHQITRMPVEGGEEEPMVADDRGTSHGPFVCADGSTVLMHSTRDGAYAIWALPVSGGEPTKLEIDGLPMAGHATCSRDRRVYALDSIRAV